MAPKCCGGRLDLTAVFGKFFEALEGFGRGGKWGGEKREKEGSKRTESTVGTAMTPKPRPKQGRRSTLRPSTFGASSSGVVSVRCHWKLDDAQHHADTAEPWVAWQDRPFTVFRAGACPSSGASTTPPRSSERWSRPSPTISLARCVLDVEWPVGGI
eukprot:scaffold1409_cov245-Pinguiococcus_pyrenoidosus.AAC.4